MRILRRTNRPATDFLVFGRRPNDSSHQDHTYRPSHQSGGVPLASVDSMYRSNQRRVHAVDTDAEGRRLGRPDDPEWNGKDALPAYDKTGSPPKYIASEQYAFGSQAPYQPQPAGALVAMPTPYVPISDSGATGQRAVGVGGASGQEEGLPGMELHSGTPSPGGLTPPPPAYHMPRN